MPPRLEMTARRNKGNRLLSKRELKEVERELTAAEAACSPMERRFCHWLVQLPPKKGFKVQAARLAGYRETSPHNLNSIAQDLLSRDRVIALIAELAKKQIRSAAPEAIAAVTEILGNPAHRDRLKAANVVLGLDPTVQRLDVNVGTK
jgi:phage terminase small subunit